MSIGNLDRGQVLAKKVGPDAGQRRDSIAGSPSPSRNLSKYACHRRPCPGVVRDGVLDEDLIRPGPDADDLVSEQVRPAIDLVDAPHAASGDLMVHEKPAIAQPLALRREWAVTHLAVVSGEGQIPDSVYGQAVRSIDVRTDAQLLLQGPPPLPDIVCGITCSIDSFPIFTGSLLPRPSSSQARMSFFWFALP